MCRLKTAVKCKLATFKKLVNSKKRSKVTEVKIFTSSLYRDLAVCIKCGFRSMFFDSIITLLRIWLKGIIKEADNDLFVRCVFPVLVIKDKNWKQPQSTQTGSV